MRQGVAGHAGMSGPASYSKSMNTITINGVTVRSDKQIRSVNGTRIQFADGSHVDTATGSVVSHGPGSISVHGSASMFGGDDADADRDTGGLSLSKGAGPRTRTWAVAQAVQLRTLTAEQLDIAVHDGPVEIEAHGTADALDAIEFSADHTRTAVATFPSAGAAVHSQRATLSMFGRRTVRTFISGAAGVERVSVKVPPGCALDVQLLGDGAALIGDVRGPLNLTAAGSREIRIGAMSRLSMMVQGAVDVSADHLSGDLVVTVQGAGNVRVSGRSDRVQAVLQGAARCRFDGSCQTADITVQGAADMFVDRCASEPQVLVFGAGRAVVSGRSYRSAFSA
jgi:hypothetical protein